jgi:hypothetical protein
MERKKADRQKKKIGNLSVFFSSSCGQKFFRVFLPHMLDFLTFLFGIITTIN